MSDIIHPDMIKYKYPEAASMIAPNSARYMNSSVVVVNDMISLMYKTFTDGYYNDVFNHLLKNDNNNNNITE